MLENESSNMREQYVMEKCKEDLHYLNFEAEKDFKYKFVLLVEAKMTGIDCCFPEVALRFEAVDEKDKNGGELAIIGYAECI